MAKEKRQSTTAPAGPGELVLQNGRQAGTRRPLASPITFVGRHPRCEIRLNVDGIDSMHCVLALGPGGLVVRDLGSSGGTFVNGVRTEQNVLQNGDTLKIGTFQFRLEMAPAALKADDASNDELRESLRIQAAAIAAQQIAVEEEESRLENRKAALRQQEEQLAAHLAEKQRQVQQWSEYTKTERENLRKERIEHEKKMSRLETELVRGKEEIEKDHQKLALERQHINKVYQRLRQRWQRQWSGQKEKYRRLAEQFEIQAKTLADTQTDLREREAALARETLAFNTDRELTTRQIQEGRDTLKKDQESWRKRRSLEFAALNTRRRELEETQVKITQARQLLLQDKEAWSQQHNALQAELHGLNNRIMHQRMRVQEQEEQLKQLDMKRRQRAPFAGAAEPVADANAPENAPIECEVEVLPDDTVIPGVDWQQRCADLDRMAAELADQRALLVEQYKRLAEIQGTWQDERSRAAAELEALAQRLASDEQDLTERQQQTTAAEELLQDRQKEIDEVRQEILVWRADLKAREKTLQDEHEAELGEIRQKDTLLRQQLAGLTDLRQRWNQRRKEEIDELQTNRALLVREQEEARADRAELFAKIQKLGEDKRVLAEKSLALEQYRQEVFRRANDPTAQRRVERLRRRWMTLNAAMIGTAKNERDHVKKELARLDERHAQLLDQIARLTQDETKLAETKSLLDEREAVMNARQVYLEQEIRKLEQAQQAGAEPALAIHEDPEVVAQEVYEADDVAIDRAA